MEHTVDFTVTGKTPALYQGWLCRACGAQIEKGAAIFAPQRCPSCDTYNSETGLCLPARSGNLASLMPLKAGNEPSLVIFTKDGPLHKWLRIGYLPPVEGAKFENQRGILVVPLHKRHPKALLKEILDLSKWIGMGSFIEATVGVANPIGSDCSPLKAKSWLVVYHQDGSIRTIDLSNAQENGCEIVENFASKAQYVRSAGAVIRIPLKGIKKILDVTHKYSDLNGSEDWEHTLYEALPE